VVSDNNPGTHLPSISIRPSLGGTARKRYWRLAHTAAKVLREMLLSGRATGEAFRNQDHLTPRRPVRTDGNGSSPTSSGDEQRLELSYVSGHNQRSTGHGMAENAKQ